MRVFKRELRDFLGCGIPIVRRLAEFIAVQDGEGEVPAEQVPKVGPRRSRPHIVTQELKDLLQAAEGGGHWLPREFPGRTIRLVQEFLTGEPPAA